MDYIESKGTEPVGLCEYKHGAGEVLPAFQMAQIRRLGERAQVLTWVAVYYFKGDRDYPGLYYNQFYLIPLHDPSGELRSGWISEYDYVSFLYRLRGESMPALELDREYDPLPEPRIA